MSTNDTLAHLDLILSGILCHLQDLVIVYDGLAALLSILATSTGGFTGAHESGGRGLVTLTILCRAALNQEEGLCQPNLALGCFGLRWTRSLPQRHCNTRQYVWVWV